MKVSKQDFTIDFFNRALTKANKALSSYGIDYHKIQFVFLMGKQQMAVAEDWAWSSQLEQGLNLVRKFGKIIPTDEIDEFEILCVPPFQNFVILGDDLSFSPAQTLQLKYAVHRADGHVDYLDALVCTGIPPQFEDAVKQAKEHGPDSLGLTGYFYNEFGQLCESGCIKKYL